MDETTHNGPAEFSDFDDTEKATAEKGGFLSEKVLHQTNTRNSGNCEYIMYLCIRQSSFEHLTSLPIFLDSNKSTANGFIELESL